ncbi:ATP-binding protein [Rheinheimera sp.]|uniref:ATP-binding protein n=1 Tax=Rheinheimera sp. TaxID=1869214 RepID=UPI00307EC5A8
MTDKKPFAAMPRLFLHFYLFISLVLVGIGWTVERLWQQVHAEQVPAWVLVLAGQISQQLKQQQLAANSHDLVLPVTALPEGSILWSDAELQQLQQGEVIPLFTKDQAFFYAMQQQQLWQLGPLDLTDDSQVPGYWFSLLFLGLLAVAVWLWLWPVARDLQRLKQQLQQGQSPVEALPVRSFIAPIAHSFQQMRQQIERLLGLQREMTQAVSHELRTPLARLSFALELSSLPETEKELMLKDVKELELLVDEMLDYARLESAQPALDWQQVDLTELLQNLCEKLSPLPGAAIETRLPPVALWWCDAHYLERAVQNLVVNAKRYAKSRVLLSLQLTATDCLLQVDDDGPGIPAAQRAEILKPFVRLDPSRQKGFGGFGLGLAIVCRVLEWHQAELEVQSNSWGGARFVLRFHRSGRPGAL